MEQVGVLGAGGVCNILSPDSGSREQECLMTG